MSTRTFGITLRPLLLALIGAVVPAQQAHVRINQVGYRVDDPKVAIAFANQPLTGEFAVRDVTTGGVVHTGPIAAVAVPEWGPAFSHYHRLDFSPVRRAGRFVVEFGDPRVQSREFTIGPYPGLHEDLLFFMRQQRCGYNPFLDVACHRFDVASRGGLRARHGRRVVAVAPDLRLSGRGR